MRPSLFLCATAFLMAQNTPGRVVLTGHIHPRAIAANDQGRVDSSLVLNHVLIMLKPSAAQQADLEKFLAELQDPSSPNFHKWLTPEQYADRFGLAQSAIDNIAAWLGGANLKVLSIARGRNAISFSGGVRQVESAFGTEIHNYVVGGEKHFANATAPSVPAAIAGYVRAIRGLDDFRMKPTLQVRPLMEKYTSGTAGTHYLAPDDIAAIYDMKPLLNGGITGAGQKIVIVGQTDIVVSDIEQFRGFFNLPAADPQQVRVPGTPDPGVLSTDLTEADLDIEFAGAAAPNATVIYVYSNDVVVSAQYAIDQNLAPVVSMSYGDCESNTGITGPEGLDALRALAQQGNTQGITWMAASGDNGAADCYADQLPGNRGAALAVDAPGSVPEITSVGGTELNEGGGTYFAPSNDPDHASVSTYVPEMAWNDTPLVGTPAATGGGVSSYFAKPAWQAGTGVPTDGFRDVPDVSFSASSDHDPRLFYTGGSLSLVGGTSVAAPTFAGIVALLNQYLVANGFQTTAGVGNVNPRLYALAQSAPGVFHDITVGSNIVDGCIGVRGCTTGPVGYNAGPGFDQTTGLGSIDVYNMVTAWHQTTTATKAVATVTLSQLAVPNTVTVAFSATVTSASGATPTGTVTLNAGGAAVATANLTAGTATLVVPTAKLSPGFNSLSAVYGGDANYATAAASIGVTVVSPTVMSILGVTNAASGAQAFSAGEIMAVYGTLLAGSALSASTLPLPTMLGGATATVNGTPAPLFFVSPGQINLQVPYGLPSGTPATLTVNYNGQSATTEFYVTNTSPGIFVDSTGAPAGAQTAKRGQTIAIYVTGLGSVSPQPATGALPSAGATPTPLQTPIITVAGVPASTVYAYLGIPAWAVGLTQINFTVPLGAPLGPQPLVVSSGTSISAPATINVTQ